MTPDPASIPMAMGRSKADPSLRMSAGARLMIVFKRGRRMPEFLTAASVRGRLSRTALSARARPPQGVQGHESAQRPMAGTGTGILPPHPAHPGARSAAARPHGFRAGRSKAPTSGKFAAPDAGQNQPCRRGFLENRLQNLHRPRLPGLPRQMEKRPPRCRGHRTHRRPHQRPVPVGLPQRPQRRRITTFAPKTTHPGSAKKPKPTLPRLHAKKAKTGKSRIATFYPADPPREAAHSTRIRRKNRRQKTGKKKPKNANAKNRKRPAPAKKPNAKNAKKRPAAPTPSTT